MTTQYPDLVCHWVAENPKHPGQAVHFIGRRPELGSDITQIRIPFPEDGAADRKPWVGRGVRVYGSTHWHVQSRRAGELSRTQWILRDWHGQFVNVPRDMYSQVVEYGTVEEYLCAVDVYMHDVERLNISSSKTLEDAVSYVRQGDADGRIKAKIEQHLCALNAFFRYAQGEHQVKFWLRYWAEHKLPQARRDMRTLRRWLRNAGNK